MVRQGLVAKFLCHLGYSLVYQGQVTMSLTPGLSAKPAQVT